MTPSELKYHVEQTGSNFFTRESMKFFGDTMKNYGCRSGVVLAQFDSEGNYHPEGIAREAWELYRKNAVKGGNQSSAYFDKQTFKRIHSIKD